MLAAAGIAFGVARSNGLGDGTPGQAPRTAHGPVVPGVSPSKALEASGRTAPDTLPAAGGEFDPDKIAALSGEQLAKLFSIKTEDVDPPDPISYAKIFARKLCGAITGTVNQPYSDEQLVWGSPDETGFPSTRNIFVPAMRALTGGLDVTRTNPSVVNYANTQTQRVWRAELARVAQDGKTGQVVECTVDPGSVTEKGFEFTVEEMNDLSAILKESAQRVKYTAIVVLGDRTDGRDGVIQLSGLEIRNR